MYLSTWENETTWRSQIGRKLRADWNRNPMIYNGYCVANQFGPCYPQIMPNAYCDIPRDWIPHAAYIYRHPAFLVVHGYAR